MPPIVQVTDLRKHYGEIEAVRGISFFVERGEVFDFAALDTERFEQRELGERLQIFDLRAVQLKLGQGRQLSERRDVFDLRAPQIQPIELLQLAERREIAHLVDGGA